MTEVPVRWASWGLLSRVIARVLTTRTPPVLVLSLPRSGSSWVGDMLGSAPDALYLREPVTQGDRTLTPRVVFDPARHPEIEPAVRRLADKAFLGLPDFSDKIVRVPEQWALHWRRPRRVLVKEVNPLACRWFLRHYRPRVILLLRNPAAVAWSSQRQGWLGPTVDEWATRGTETGLALREARDALADYPDHTKILFEDLCRDPVEGFRRLYEFAGLAWTEGVVERIREYSHDSAGKVDAWRTGADPGAASALLDAYRAFGLEWYGSDPAAAAVDA